MTALFMDGFAHYGTSNGNGNVQAVANMLAGPYAQVDVDPFSGPYVGPAPYGAPTGTYAIGSFHYRASGTTIRRVLPGARSKLYTSFRWGCDSLPADNNAVSICDWRDGSNNVLYYLKVNTTGGLEIRDGSSTLIAATSGPIVTSQNFEFIETLYDSTGHSIQVRVNDAQATQAVALTATIGSTQVAQLGFLANWMTGLQGRGIMSYITDVFVRDDQGTTNNGWLGDRRVATLYANADGTPSGWTPSYYKEFGVGILPLNGSNAYLSAAGSTAFDLGSSDFTLESFVRFDTLPGPSNYASIFNRWDSANNHRSYRLILGGSAFNSGSLQFDTSTDGNPGTVVTKIQYPWTPVLNTWYHIALVRASGQLLLFVNGQQLGLPINDTDTYYGGGSEVFSIGAEIQGSGTPVSGSYMNARLDETRITNGFARYTAPFATPASAFPRGSGSDAHWSQVSLLMGYDNAVTDESSYTRTVTAANCASFLPNDGPLIGKYSTVNKAIPDDHTFISAALLNASNILTMTSQPTNGTTVTVGTKNGSTAAVYTFKTAITTAFDVLIDTTAQNTLMNLLYAINAGSGAGTKYGTGTTANFDVNASQLPVGQIQVFANTAGTSGNSIASTSTSTASWATSTLTGGANIPDSQNFKLQRPPNNTTVISAMQLNVRALKTDSGTATMQNAFVGPLGTVENGASHPLTVTANDYADILELDPDTSGPITPTTMINGQLRINRTA